MAKLTRRRFLRLASIGAAGVAGLALAKVSMEGFNTDMVKAGPEGAGADAAKGSLRFVAMGPLPPAKVSPIATLVVSGYVSPGRPATGQVTTQVLPGNPTESDQPFPGMTKVGQVESARVDSLVRLAGRIESTSSLAATAAAGNFEILIDPDAKLARARIQGVEYPLEIKEYSTV